jgi:hypothetical protein
MRRKWVISLLIGALVAVGIGVVTFSKSPRKPEVTMTYLGTRTNNGFPQAVFTVANSSRKRVHVKIANVARKDGNAWRYDLQGMSIFSRFCSVEAGSNSTIAVFFPINSRPWIVWRVEAGVFEPSTTLQTGKFAARRLWSHISGKTKYTQFWVPGFIWAYEINSGDAPGVALGWPPNRTKPKPPRKPFEESWPTDFRWTKDASEVDPWTAPPPYSP